MNFIYFYFVKTLKIKKNNILNLTGTVLYNQQLSNVLIFLSGLKSDLLIPFNAIDLLLRDKDLSRDKVDKSLSLAKEYLHKIFDNLQPHYDTLTELTMGVRVKPQFGWI